MFRQQMALTFELEVVALLKPAFYETRKMYDNLRFNNHGWPPTVDTFNDMHNLSHYLRAQWPSVQRNVHLGKADQDPNKRIYTNFIGNVVVLTTSHLQEYLENPDKIDATSTASFVGLLRAPPTQLGDSSEGYLVDVQVSGGRTLNGFDYNTGVLGPTLAQIPTMPCSASMAPLWADSAKNQNPSYHNISWWGPNNPKLGWGNHFEANIPILDGAGRQIGRAGNAISFLSITDLLQESIQNGGQVTTGGHSMLYTEKGLVLGFTENFNFSLTKDIEVQTTDALFKDRATTLSAGLGVVAAGQEGVQCPESSYRGTLNHEGVAYLLEVHSIDVESHGLPPLPDRWCHFSLLPRRNTMHEFDAARKANDMSITSVIVGGVVLVLLVALLLFKAHQKSRQLAKQLDQKYRAEVKRLVGQDVQLLASLVVVTMETFLEFEELPIYETVRDMGKAVHLDTEEAVLEFQRKGNKFLFISHEWLGFSEPDPQGVQLECMKCTVRKIAKTVPPGSLHIWLDIISVPQKNRNGQALAVSSLPAFARFCDVFAVVAPNAYHAEANKSCSLDSYKTRGWCRMELLSKVSASGLRNMWFVSGTLNRQNDGSNNPDSTHGLKFEKLPDTKEKFRSLPFDVFNGQFSCCAHQHKGSFSHCDKEKLVRAATCLYAGCIKGRHDHAELRSVIEGLCQHGMEGLDKYFPKTHDLERPGGAVERGRELFGPLIGMVGEHLAFSPAEYLNSNGDGSSGTSARATSQFKRLALASVSGSRSRSNAKTAKTETVMLPSLESALESKV
jgi:hypothetical protein